MEQENKLDLVRAALDMLESTETVIENKEVTVEHDLYGEKQETQPVVTQQPTFRGEDRKRIKQWLLAQLV